MPRIGCVPCGCSRFDSTCLLEQARVFFKLALLYAQRPKHGGIPARYHGRGRGSLSAGTICNCHVLILAIRYGHPIWSSNRTVRDCSWTVRLSSGCAVLWSCSLKPPGCDLAVHFESVSPADGDGGFRKLTCFATTECWLFSFKS